MAFLLLQVYAWQKCSAQLITQRFDIYNSTLPSNIIYNIICDKEGFIWMATNKGLVKFNGSRFQVFNTQNGLPDDDIVNAFYFPDRDEIWPMSYNGKIFSINALTDKINEIYTSSGMRGGAMMYAFATNDSVKVLNISQVLSVHDTSVVVRPHYFDVYKEYLDASPSLDNMAIPGKPKKLDWTQVKENVVDTLHTDGRNRILKYGLISINRKLFGRKGNDYIEVLDLSSFILSPDVFILDIEIVDDDLYVAVTGAEGGVFLSKNFFQETIPAPTFRHIGMEGNATAICRDKIGNIWYGIKGKGLFFIQNFLLNVPFCELTDFSAMPLQDHFIIPESDSIVLITEYRNGFIRLNNITGSPAFFSNAELTRRSHELIMPLDRRQTLKDISHDGKMFLYPHGQIALYDTTKRQFKIIRWPKSHISLKCGDYHGQYILFATSGANQFYRQRITGTNPERITLPPDADIINDIYYKDDHLILLCTRNGVLRTDSTFRQFYQLSSTSYNKVAANNNNFYFINDKELALYQPEKDIAIRPLFNSKYLLPPFIITDVGVSHSGVHILTDKGYLYFENSMFRNTSLLAADFKLWSIHTYDRDYFISREEVNIGHQSGKLVTFFVHFLDPQNDMFEKSFSFTPNRVAEKDNWVNFKGENFIPPNLSAGNYRLKIRVRIPETGYEKIVSYHIKVEAYFWQTTWFGVVGLMMLIAVSISGTYAFGRRRHKRKIEKMRLQRHLEELENKVFLNQLNPHFLYNTLNTLQDYLIRKDTHNGIIYLQRVSAISRNIIDFHRTVLITVQEEITFLEKYTFIQQKRYGDKFSFIIECPEVLKTECIPPMLIQPLVENAIEHGLADIKSGGLVVVCFRKEAKMLIVSIKDNGTGKVGDAIPLKEGHALHIINQRLNLSINNPDLNTNFLTVSAHEFSGLIVQIKIPIICQS